MGSALQRRASPSLLTAEPGARVPLDAFTLEAVARSIRARKLSRVIVCLGAGVSTAAGIPDFRSRGCGLYDTLADEGLDESVLPSPESVFSLDFFRKNPKPFLRVARLMRMGSASPVALPQHGGDPAADAAADAADTDAEVVLPPTTHKPTVAHSFIKLLADKGLLLRCYSQNIDGLELQAGLDPELLVQAHGGFQSAHCVGCGEEHSVDDFFVHAVQDKVLRCGACEEPVKPDIVFFGEQLPDRFSKLAATDFAKCDLLIIMGTSLQVQPFAGLVDEVPDNAVRLLLNRVPVGKTAAADDLFMPLSGLLYDTWENRRDVFAKGDCDDLVTQLAKMLKWHKDLDKLREKVQ